MHNHGCIRDEIEKQSLMERIKHTALETTESARNILHRELTSCPETFIQNNLNIKYIKDVFARSRRKNNITLPLDSDIPLELQTLTNGDNFYYYDSGCIGNDRIVVFTTYSNLALLCMQKKLVNRWYV